MKNWGVIWLTIILLFLAINVIYKANSKNLNCLSEPIKIEYTHLDSQINKTKIPYFYFNPCYFSKDTYAIRQTLIGFNNFYKELASSDAMDKLKHHNNVVLVVNGQVKKIIYGAEDPRFFQHNNKLYLFISKVHFEDWVKKEEFNFLKHWNLKPCIYDIQNDKIIEIKGEKFFKEEKSWIAIESCSNSSDNFVHFIYSFDEMSIIRVNILNGNAQFLNKNEETKQPTPGIENIFEYKELYPSFLYRGSTNFIYCKKLESYISIIHTKDLFMSYYHHFILIPEKVLKELCSGKEISINSDLIKISQPFKFDKNQVSCISYSTTIEYFVQFCTSLRLEEESSGQSPPGGWLATTPSIIIIDYCNNDSVNYKMRLDLDHVLDFISTQFGVF